MTAADSDIYQRITDHVMDELEKGALPWVQSWDSGQPVSRPLQHDGKPYRGLNTLILWGEGLKQGYDTPYWMTLKRSNDLGGRVRKGSKGTQTVFYKELPREEAQDGDDEPHGQRIMKTYYVFNAGQIDGLPEKYYAQEPPDVTFNPIEDAEAFFAKIGIPITHKGRLAYYDPIADEISLPEPRYFNDEEAYYGTLTHEAHHWTGHEDRLDRLAAIRKFGDKAYAFEELQTQMGAAFTCADRGWVPIERQDTVSYINDWLKMARLDKTVIPKAAASGERSARYLERLYDEADERLEAQRIAAIGVEPYASRG